MEPTDREKKAFESLSNSKELQILLEFYERLLTNLCDVRNLKTESIESAKLSAYFLQTEFIDRIRNYKRPVAISSDSDYT